MTKNYQNWSQKCHAQNNFQKNYQKYFDSSAKTVENEFPAFQNTCTCVFRCVLEIFRSLQQKHERDRSVT